MSEMDVPVLVNYDDDELDQQLRNVQQEETETNDGGNGDGGNCNDGNLPVNSQVPLFEAVRSPTDEMTNGRVRLAPKEGRDGQHCQDGGPCQQPVRLTLTNPADPVAAGQIFCQIGQVY